MVCAAWECPTTTASRQSPRSAAYSNCVFETSSQGRSGATAVCPSASSSRTPSAKHQPPCQAPCTRTNRATWASIPTQSHDGKLVRHAASAGVHGGDKSVSRLVHRFFVVVPAKRDRLGRVVRKASRRRQREEPARLKL